MKPRPLFTLLAATLLCAASPLPLSAAEVEVDISSFAPHNPDVVLRQIELNLAIKQYEKVLMGLHDGALERDFGPQETGLSEEQRKQWQQRADQKLRYLEETAARLRAQIRSDMAEASKDAASFEAENAAQNSGPKAAPSQPKREASALLQGRWEGFELGRESAGHCTVDVSGDRMRFQTANQNEWYEATFALPAGPSPEQLLATITGCPVPEMVGGIVHSIYEIEDGKLTLVGHGPGVPEAPKTFAGDPDSRAFVFRKVQHR